MTGDPAAIPHGLPARHDLLLVAPADWPRVVATCPLSFPQGSAQAREIALWGHAGRPVIARRRSTCDAVAGLAVGLPLPPPLGKLRVPLLLPEGIGFGRRAPVGLQEVSAVAPVGWRKTIAALVALGDALSVIPEVFGALLWQMLTGLPYLHARSDLDLLWRIGDPAALPPLLDGLARIERDAPMAIDGEILTDRGGVNWRELARALHGEADDVMAKTIGHIALVSPAELFFAEPAPCY